MASYEGIPLPKIYEAQMPSVGGGWDMVGKIIPTLANAYLRGMQQEEMNQLRADTTMYSAIASSSKNYLEPEPIKELIESLTVERDSQLASGDTIRANYINASIASMQPWLMTREKQGTARDLINIMEKNMDAIENTPGYEGKALDLLNDMLDNLNEYEPYFSTRMIKDINDQETELNSRLSALSVLKDIDDDELKLDEKGETIVLPGIQVTRAYYPSEESYIKAKQAVDLLQIAIQGKDVNTKLLNQGLTLHNQALNEWNVASSEQMTVKRELHRGYVNAIIGAAKEVEAKFYIGGQDFSEVYPESFENMNLTQNFDAVLRAGETVMSEQRYKQLRNIGVHDLVRILEKSSVPSKDLQKNIELWAEGGYMKDAKILDTIYEQIAHWKPDSKLSQDDYDNNINYTGWNLVGDEYDTNVKNLVKQYLSYLKQLDVIGVNLSDLWGWEKDESIDLSINEIQNLKNWKNKQTP